MVNKPTISRQLDYYIARLHWIESTGGTMDSVADRLSEVLHGQKEWPVVASPPSLSRRFRYAWPAFAGASTAILIGILFVGLMAWYLIGRATRVLSSDYRSLGWITISTGSDLAPDAPIPITAELWLSDAGLPFGRTQLRTTAHPLSGNLIRSDLSYLLDPAQTGHGPISFAVPPSTDHLSTFFRVPSSKPELQFCVQQEFNISVRVRHATIQESGEPNVTEVAPNRPCG